MIKEPVKSESQNIQQQHVRRYRRTGKVTLVNKSNTRRVLPRATMNPPKQYSLGKSPKSKLAFEEPKIRFQEKKRVLPESSLGDKKQVDDFATNMVAMLTFTTIAFPGWESAYPPLIADRLQMARMIQAMKDPKDFKEYATDEEALGYLSTMSLAGPLRSEFAEIMVYLFNKVMPKDKIPADLEMVKGLSPTQMSDLRQLKRNIRKSQWKVFKEREKERKDNEGKE